MKDAININGHVYNLDQLNDIKEEWSDLFHLSSHRSPFLSFEYLNLWYRMFSTPDCVRVYRAEIKGQTIGFLPLVMTGKHQFRILRSLTNDHCMHSGPLVRKGFENIFPTIILDQLLKDHKLWDLIQYDFSFSFTEFPCLFDKDLLKNKGLAFLRHAEPTYIVNLENSFEEYLQNDLTKNFRRNLKRSMDALDRSGRWEFEHLTGGQAIKLWPQFITIEDSGWKGEAGTSIKKGSVALRSYYQELLVNLAAQDHLLLSFLKLNGTRIAGGFGYIEGDIYHYAKSGYLQAYGTLSPSHLLKINIIQHLILNCPCVCKVHSFPWDNGYKHKFANSIGQSTNMLIFGLSLRGQAAYLASAFHRKLIPIIPGSKFIVALMRRLSHENKSPRHRG